jgi:hypothetical protein
MPSKEIQVFHSSSDDSSDDGYRQDDVDDYDDDEDYFIGEDSGVDDYKPGESKTKSRTQITNKSDNRVDDYSSSVAAVSAAGHTYSSTTNGSSSIPTVAPPTKISEIFPATSTVAGTPNNKETRVVTPTADVEDVNER